MDRTPGNRDATHGAVYQAVTRLLKRRSLFFRAPAAMNHPSLTGEESKSMWPRARSAPILLQNTRVGGADAVSV